MRNSMIKNLIIKPLICLLAGVAAIVIGGVVFAIPDYYVDNTATITSIDTYYNGSDEEHTVMVQYKVDGKTYNEELNEYASNFKVGQEVKIKYDPDYPQNMCSASKLPKILFIGLGIVTILCGILGALKTLSRGR